MSRLDTFVSPEQSLPNDTVTTKEPPAHLANSGTESTLFASYGSDEGARRPTRPSFQDKQ